MIDDFRQAGEPPRMIEPELDPEKVAKSTARGRFMFPPIRLTRSNGAIEPSGRRETIVMRLIFRGKSRLPGHFTWS